MLIVINLKTTSHHLVVHTNWLLHLFLNKKIIFQNIKFSLILFLFFKIKKSQLMLQAIFKT